MQRISILVISALGLLFVACAEEAPSGTPSTAASSATSPTHAATGVVPGSHEDWCGEHGVPESLCTRCNPSLAAAFKATGDWCDEHDLPESQCLICNPTLRIVRPAPAAGH